MKRFLTPKVMETAGRMLALTLIAGTMGVGIWTAGRTWQGEPEPATTLQLSPVDAVPEGLETIPEKEPATAAPRDIPVAVGTEAPRPVETTEEAPAETKALTFLHPVLGETTRPYGENMIYFATADSWAIHPAIDVWARESQTVYAMADGIVTFAGMGNLGFMVEIAHPGGITTRYGSLDSLPPVKTGDAVEMGDPIGRTGESLSREALEGPHLHLEAEQNGKPINPMSLLN